ncbi:MULTISPECIES: copper resistance protein CopC [unclassified Arthrobacter]|uniref:copper resistance CopC family protein n=1 Tax=unclassified Arthrobacter TaxID=235627 RepID=UPI002882F129|nr:MULTISPECIES: copper resistance protein CopC [unclassified Arthrobacter]
MASYSLHSFSWRIPERGRYSLLLAVLLCLGLALVGAPSASAHDVLASSTPGTNERLPEAPSSVALRFSAPLLKIGHEIRVVDAASKNWVQSEPVLARETLTQPLAADLPPGEYQVRWRVVSSDGHPINGSYSFLVGADAKLGSVPAPGAASGPADPVIQTEADAAAASNNPAIALPGWLVAAGIGAAAGLGLYLLWGFILRGRRAASNSD